ncbi:uncharacterized protein LOC131282119 [Anopheles ziemanni]|uniref:uncharacterized protein LOC131265963 n=1 Tax=Anopheles coustani TaxID=139045 RepID=UPI0026583DFA|nr:uncharacterized protein LOC131265963 [Anopheles coustani]XP_058167499.1 uncharacterized protein LOC131282119 [Anopheles ziemanni]
MPLMRIFCFRLTVRLGSIIVGGCCMLETFITMIMLAACGGADFFKSEALYYEENLHIYNPHVVFVWLIGVCKTEPELFYAAIMSCMGLYLPCCGAMMAGAYFMKRYLLVPYILVELLRLVCITLTHVIGMIVIKKSINVGYLIAFTIAGGFALLLLFYLWACVVALMQILKIVRSPEYIAVFGDDPLAPVEPQATGSMDIFAIEPKYPWNDKGTERMSPAALALAPYTGTNMLIDDFRPLHSRYLYNRAV